jgi:chemotaxis response regulator CheB
MKVLIVEDEAIIAMHLEMMVVEFGHEVFGIAASSDEAIALTIACRPDVALMDATPVWDQRDRGCSRVIFSLWASLHFSQRESR